LSVASFPKSCPWLLFCRKTCHAFVMSWTLTSWEWRHLIGPWEIMLRLANYNNLTA
jgi:hypothetical protein